MTVPLVHGTISHTITAPSAPPVFLMPADAGTSHRRLRSRAVARLRASPTSSPSVWEPETVTVVKAAIKALSQLRTPQDVERLRGVSLT